MQANMWVLWSLGEQMGKAMEAVSHLTVQQIMLALSSLNLQMRGKLESLSTTPSLILEHDL